MCSENHFQNKIKKKLWRRPMIAHTQNPTRENQYEELIHSKQCKHLGALISYIKFSIWDKWIELTRGCNIIKCLLHNQNNDLKISNVLVRSRLTYGCRVWRPSLWEMSKHLSLFDRFLRSMTKNVFSWVKKLSLHQTL